MSRRRAFRLSAALFVLGSGPAPVSAGSRYVNSVSDLFQDFGHGSGGNHVASGIFPMRSAESANVASHLTMKAAILSAGTS